MKNGQPSIFRKPLPKDPTQREKALDKMDRLIHEARVRNRKKDGFVYFIQSGGFVKIGYTDNPRTRFKAFVTTNPVRCKLIGLLRAGQSMEKKLHIQFCAERYSGEWFLLTAYLRLEIAKLCGDDWKQLIPKKPKLGERSEIGPIHGGW